MGLTRAPRCAIRVPVRPTLPATGDRNLFVTRDEMKKFKMLGKRVLLRTPGSKETPEYLPGIVASYNIHTHKVSVVATKPEGFQLTVHNVPYDPNMALENPRSGCWCHLTDLVEREEPAEIKTKEPVAG